MREAWETGRLGFKLLFLQRTRFLTQAGTMSLHTWDPHTKMLLLAGRHESSWEQPAWTSGTVPAPARDRRASLGGFSEASSPKQVPRCGAELASRAPNPPSRWLGPEGLLDRDSH